MLNRQKSSNIESEAMLALTMISEIQKEIHLHPLNEDLHRQEKSVMQKCKRLITIRMLFLRQKVKSEWIKEGDENTTYFHICIRKRKLQKQVYKIKNAVGVWQEDLEDIENAFVQYYESLLGVDDSNISYVSTSIIREGPLVSGAQHNVLCAPFSGEDVKLALFDINENKAVGPNGYLSDFF